MEEDYDVVICGTGLMECILSGLLSVHGKKVLHVDRNSYYGGESASLNLTTLYDKFAKGTPPEALGANREWNVDLVPKFVMASGTLVKILLKTKVTRYLEWQVIEGTYVYQHQKKSLLWNEKFIHKVPATEMETITSPLMPLLEKNRCKNFIHYCVQWDADKKETHKPFAPQRDTMATVYSHFGLQENTVDFIGHAIALYPTDDYINQPMEPTLKKLLLYMNSITRYGQSPFIYPVYGLGGLPEGFSRLSAVHGGTYMVNKPIDCVLYDDDGKVRGVKAVDGEIARCKIVLCDPSYVKDSPTDGNKVKHIGEVIRCICILRQPIPETDGKASCQVIIPQKQLKRQNDIYIAMVSSTHGVARKGYYVAIVSTTVETNDPHREIQPALERLGPIVESFVYISSIYEPVTDGKADNLYISKSFDASSHFESAADEVLRIWKNIMGSDLDLTATSTVDDE